MRFRDNMHIVSLLLLLAVALASCSGQSDVPPATIDATAEQPTIAPGVPTNTSQVPIGPIGIEDGDTRLGSNDDPDEIGPDDQSLPHGDADDNNECTDDILVEDGSAYTHPPKPDGTLCNRSAELCQSGQCGTCLIDPPPLSVSAVGRVIPIYLVATDTTPQDQAWREDAFNRLMIALQYWYRDAMGPAYDEKTFAYEPARVLASSHSRQEWDDFGIPDCGIWLAASTELFGTNGRDGLLAAAGLPDLGAPNVLYMVVGGGGYRGGCGSPSMAALEELALDRFVHRCPNAQYDDCARDCSDPAGLAAIDPWCELWPHTEPNYGCAPVGGFTHELGHGFGLPHVDLRPTSTGVTIMDEWWNFGHDAVLSIEDREELYVSPYFAIPE